MSRSSSARIPHRVWRFSRLAAVLAAWSCFTLAAHAGVVFTLSWDQAGAGKLGGSGIWNNSNAFWWNSAADVGWTSSSGATFATTGTSPASPYTVLVDSTSGGAVTVSQIIATENGYTIAGNTPGDSLTLNGSVVSVANGRTFAISVPLAGNASLTKTSPGTLILSGASTYTGNTNILAGSGIIQLDGSLYGVTGAGSISVGGASQLNLTHSNTFGTFSQVPGSSITASRDVNLGQAVVLQSPGLFNTLNNVTLNGSFLGGNGGQDATFPTFQLKGTVTVGGSAVSAISTSGTNSGIQLGDNTAGGVTIFNVANATGDSASDLTISGNLKNGRNVANTANVASGLTKNGAGTLEIQSPAYTGPTTVNAGVLFLSIGFTGNSTTTVNNTGTATGGGAYGPLTLTSGGTYNPSFPEFAGNGTVQGSFNLQSGGHLAIDIGGAATAGIDYDRLTVLGGGALVTLAGDLQINLVNGYVPQLGDSFGILDNIPFNVISGAFSNAPGGIITSGGVMYQVNYAADLDQFGAGPNNDIVLTVVPEPGAAFSLFLGGALLVGRRRRTS